MPTLDGEDSSYFEWLGAGDVEVREVAGAMHQSDRRGRILTGIKFGFDPERLFIRLDVAERPPTCSPRAIAFGDVPEPEGIRLVFAEAGRGASDAVGSPGRGTSRWSERASGATVAADTILEVAVPLADFRGRRRAARCPSWSTVNEPGGTRSRAASGGSGRVELPSPRFEAGTGRPRNWQA